MHRLKNCSDRYSQVTKQSNVDCDLSCYEMMKHAHNFHCAYRVVVSSKTTMDFDKSAQWDHTAVGLSDVYNDRQV